MSREKPFWTMLVFILLAANMTLAEIKIYVKQPTQGQSWFGYVFFITEITSTFQVQSVLARCGNDSMTLDPSGSEFLGKVVLNETIPETRLTCSVTVTDYYANRKSSEVEIVINRSPRFESILPIWTHLAFTGEPIRFRAACFDEDPCQIQNVNGGEWSQNGETDSTLYLPKRDYPYNLLFRAKDSYGVYSSRIASYVVIDKGQLERSKTFGGQILAWEGTRGLIYNGYKDVVYLHDTLTGKSDTVPYSFRGMQDQQPTVLMKGSRFLIGIIENDAWTVIVGNDSTNWIFKSPTRDRRCDLGDINDNFGSWETWNGWYTVDFRNGTLSVVEKYQLSPQDSGTVSLGISYPGLADGIRMIYAKETAGHIDLFSMEGDTSRLIASNIANPYRRVGFQVGIGWIAVLKNAGATNTEQLFLIDPSGKESQVTFFGSPVRLKSFCPDGRALVDVDIGRINTFYLVDREGQPKFVTTGKGDLSQVCGSSAPLFRIGNTFLSLGEPPVVMRRNQDRPKTFRWLGRRLDLGPAASQDSYRASVYALNSSKLASAPAIHKDGNQMFLDFSGIEIGMYWLRLESSQGSQLHPIVIR
jgi:hypothetical protein